MIKQAELGAFVTARTICISRTCFISVLIKNLMEARLLLLILKFDHNRQIDILDFLVHRLSS